MQGNCSIRVQKWTSGMCKFGWGLCGWLLEALHWASADQPLAQVLDVVVMEIEAGKIAGSCNSLVQFTVVHLYKRAQFWFKVGFYPKLLYLQWECIGMEQICTVLKSISELMRGGGGLPLTLPYFAGGTRPGNLPIAKQWWEQLASWSDFNEEKEY